MITNPPPYNFFKKEVILFFILYSSILIGFLFSENSTGGAIIDYKNQKIITESFVKDFIYTLYNYDSFSSRHSPILIIFLSFLEKLNIHDSLIRITYLHLCLFLPLIFYLILKEKFNIKNNNSITLILVSLIFLSPTFRTLSIWPDSRILGLTLFSLSLLFFLKFQNTKNYKFAILNIFTCAISSYVSPNFSVLSIFFYINYILFYGFFSRKFIFIILISLFLCYPAVHYIFILDINFINKSAAIGGIDDHSSIFFINISNNILITFSIIFFYLIPFLFTRVLEINKIFTFNNFFISFVIFIALIYNFDYRYELSGGGFFFKISNYFFQNNYLFFFISYLSILTIIPILKENIFNSLLFVLIILNNPQYTIYHKYFDPLILILFFSILSLKTNISLIKKPKNIFLIYNFFLSFLLLSIYK